MTNYLNDLKIQAMLFDMDIDFETFELVPKRKKYEVPKWVERWKEKRAEADFDEYFDIDRSDIHD